MTKLDVRQTPFSVDELLQLAGDDPVLLVGSFSPGARYKAIVDPAAGPQNQA
jgi:hypothetical protein